MADGVNSYLLFFSAGSHFLLPLSCVKRVTDMKEREPEMALADFLELPEAGNLSDQAYLIIADCGDREIGIRAEVVTGLVQVEEEQIYASPEAASGTSKVRNSSGRISLPAGAGTILKKRCAHSRLEKVLPSDLVYFPQSVVYR